MMSAHVVQERNIKTVVEEWLKNYICTMQSILCVVLLTCFRYLQKINKFGVIIMLLEFENALNKVNELKEIIREVRDSL